MILEMFTTGTFETHGYLVSCPETLKAFAIDVPPDSYDKFMQSIDDKKLSLEKIFLTHSHWDHIADVAPLQEATGASVCLHPADIDNLRTPGVDGLTSPIAIKGVEPEILLQEGQEFFVGSVMVRVVATPGHTLGGVCFYLPQEGLLFSGDTVFKGSMGRVDFPNSRPDLMWGSLQKIAKLPLDTKIHPGHGPSTKIEKESWLAFSEQRFGSQIKRK